MDSLRELVACISYSVFVEHILSKLTLYEFLQLSSTCRLYLRLWFVGRIWNRFIERDYKTMRDVYSLVPIPYNNYVPCPSCNQYKTYRKLATKYLPTIDRCILQLNTTSYLEIMISTNDIRWLSRPPHNLMDEDVITSEIKRYKDKYALALTLYGPDLNLTRSDGQYVVSNPSSYVVRYVIESCVIKILQDPILLDEQAVRRLLYSCLLIKSINILSVYDNHRYYDERITSSETMKVVGYDNLPVDITKDVSPIFWENG